MTSQVDERAVSAVAGAGMGHALPSALHGSPLVRLPAEAGLVAVQLMDRTRGNVREHEFMRAVIRKAMSAISDQITGWAWRNLALHFTLRSGIRIRLACDSEWVVYNDIFVDGEYDDPIHDAIAHSDHRTPLQFLDLGANVGFFALRLAHHIALEAPTTPYCLTLVEGSPSNFRTLRRRITEQRALQGEIRLTNGLVGRRTGTGKIREARFHGASAVVKQPGAKGATVAYVDLAKLFPDHGSVIHLLKCDVEGSEQEFIENYTTLFERVERAVFEFHHECCDVEACLQRLAAAGLSKRRRLRWFQDSLRPRSIDYLWR